MDTETAEAAKQVCYHKYILFPLIHAIMGKLNDIN